jgi:hypothetical protein
VGALPAPGRATNRDQTEKERGMTAQRFSRVTVTPTLASKWLKDFNYTDNRPIAIGWVDYLARQMDKGLWQDNGEPLIFDGEGNLLDGQHRLAAVIKSGKQQTFDVRRGVETHAFTTIDQGRNRSPAQVLGMLGVKNASTVASICRLIYNWEVSGQPFVGRRISPDEIQLVRDLYEGEVEAATQVTIGCRRDVPAPASIIGFCAYLFTKVSKRKAEAFFRTLKEGVADSPKDPALVLRNRLYKEAVANSRRSLPKRAMLGLFIRGWNAYHKGDLVSQLQIKPDGEGGFKLPAVRGLGRSQGGKGCKAPKAS